MACQVKASPAWVGAALGRSGCGQHDAPADRNSEDAAEGNPGGGGGGDGGPAPIRPQATRPAADGDAGSKQALAAAAALEWQPSLSNKHHECSATSDEDHPRLVPRRGAGPELRSGGQEIDEYLMRLLHAGSPSTSEAAVFHSNLQAKRGRGEALAPAAVSFPAGWDTGRPWFLTEQAGRGAALPVKLPPPPFPAQPVQRSRLGPLPPTGLFAQRQSRPSAAAAKAAAAAAPPDPAEACPPKPRGNCASGELAAKPERASWGSGATDATAAAGAPSRGGAKGSERGGAKPGAEARPRSASRSAGAASTALESKNTVAVARTPASGASGGASGSAAATDSVCADTRFCSGGSGSGGANSTVRDSGADGRASATPVSTQRGAQEARAPEPEPAAPKSAACTRAERVHARLGDAAYARLRDAVIAQHAQHREQVAELHRLAKRQVQLQLALASQQRAAAAIASYSMYPFAYGGFPTMPPLAPAAGTGDAAAADTGKPAGGAAAPAGDASSAGGPGVPWFAAALAQAQAQAFGASGFDPMGAWYAHHLGHPARTPKGGQSGAAAFSNSLAGMGDGMNPWMAQAGQWPYMQAPGGMERPAQAYEGAYGAAAVPEASPQPAASQESARESAPASAADSGCTASFGGDCTLPAKKRGRNAAATSRRGSTEPELVMKRPCIKV